MFPPQAPRRHAMNVTPQDPRPQAMSVTPQDPRPQAISVIPLDPRPQASQACITHAPDPHLPSPLPRQAGRHSPCTTHSGPGGSLTLGWEAHSLWAGRHTHKVQSGSETTAPPWVSCKKAAHRHAAKTISHMHAWLERWCTLSHGIHSHHPPPLHAEAPTQHK